MKNACGLAVAVLAAGLVLGIGCDSGPSVLAERAESADGGFGAAAAPADAGTDALPRSDCMSAGAVGSDTVPCNGQTCTNGDCTCVSIDHRCSTSLDCCSGLTCGPNRTCIR